MTRSVRNNNVSSQNSIRALGGACKVFVPLSLIWLMRYVIAFSVATRLMATLCCPGLDIRQSRHVPRRLCPPFRRSAGADAGNVRQPLKAGVLDAGSHASLRHGWAGTPSTANGTHREFHRQRPKLFTSTTHRISPGGMTHTNELPEFRAGSLTKSIRKEWPYDYASGSCGCTGD